MTTRTFDIRQIIDKVDPDNKKRKTLTYEWSNGKRFYKNELPGTAYVAPEVPEVIESAFSSGFSEAFS